MPKVTNKGTKTYSKKIRQTLISDYFKPISRWPAYKTVSKHRTYLPPPEAELKDPVAPRKLKPPERGVISADKEGLKGSYLRFSIESIRNTPSTSKTASTIDCSAITKKRSKTTTSKTTTDIYYPD